MIEIKTLSHYTHEAKENMDRQDAELARALNEGWEIIPALCGITSVMNDTDSYDLRVVTLKREISTQPDSPLELTITEQVTLMTLLHAHLNADQPQRAREMIANDIADFAEGKNRARFAHMGLANVLKEYGASASPRSVPESIVEAYKAAKKEGNKPANPDTPMSKEWISTLLGLYFAVEREISTTNDH
jgi:hypothetical protein